MPESATTPSGDDIKVKSILMVDDDPLITATIASNLRRAGYLVITANDPEQALAQCKTTSFNLAIIDQRMPNMSGTELAHRLLREYGVYSLFLSAYGNPELVDLAAAAGAISYVLKPIDPASLRPAVQTALTRIDEIRSLLHRESQLRQALTSEREINTAIGILMERSKATRTDAFEMLRRYARNNRIQITKVASDILDPINASHELLGNIMRLQPNKLPTTESASPGKEK